MFMASKTPSKSKKPSPKSELTRLREENERLKQTLNPKPVPDVLKVSTVPTTLSMVEMIIGCILGVCIGISGILAIANIFASVLPFNPNDYNLGTQEIGAIMIMIAIVEVAVTVLFYNLFRKIEKDNKKHIALCVCAIIFGGIFNLIGGIICLCDANRKN